MPETRIIRSLEELASLARDVVSVLPLHHDRATLLGLSGELGAGKTAFTKEVARALGVRGEVTSPTFVIEKRYSTGDTRFPSLVHIDAYRLAGPEELERIGFRETTSIPGRLVILEWPEIVAGALPQDMSVITLRSGANQERIVILPDTISISV